MLRGIVSRFTPNKYLHHTAKYLISTLATPWYKSLNSKSHEYTLP